MPTRSVQGDAIVGSVNVDTAQFGGQATKELSLIRDEWRGALSLYLNAAGAPPLLNGLSLRVYAHAAGTRTLVRQFLYTGLFPAVVPIAGDPQSGKRDMLLGRVTGIECEEFEVCASCILAQAPAYNFVLNYVLRGREPLPVTGRSTARFIPAATAVPGVRLTQIHGTLHQIWAINTLATDTWLYLFDDASWRPGFASFPPPNGSPPRLPPLYVPPNSKGLASMDFGERGIPALWALNAYASSDAGTFTADATARIQLCSEIS